MKILTQFELNGKASYPDDYRLFTNMEKVEIEGELYWLCDYTGSMNLENGTYTYESWQASLVKPVIQLTNFTVKSNNEIVEPQGGIYWVGTDDKLEVTADVVDTDNILASVMSTTGKDTLSMVIITQEVFNGDYSNIKDSTRFKVDIADNVMTLVSNKGFGASGNYIVAKERLNLGLDNINAPFHIEMDTIEFDVLNG